ncbi:cuticle protein 19.8-like [Cylas formicarius]|uniref:cuticle protein 19.8-like n=1 Tax=Cylas formicarius TaxID=197179 RepID=UPI002958AF41|nr:cuticle protein 19.8-like [Cylas formicarius]
MKFFIFASAFLVFCDAVPSPGILAPIGPVALTTAPVFSIPAKVSSQYHSQDGLGHYAYGYSNDLSAKNEIKQLDGTTVGSYSYVDAEGQIQNVQYRSDDVNGFRVFATNLPVAPLPIDPIKVALPQPVQDTPEVVQARSQHLAAVKEAEKPNETTTTAEPEKLTEPSPTVAENATDAVIPQAPASILRAALPVVHAPSLVATPFSYGFSYSTVQLNPYVAQPLISTYHGPVFSQEQRHLVLETKHEEQVVDETELNQESGVVVEAARSDNQATAPLPIAPQFTPEVAKARAEHLEAVENIKKDIEKQ